MDNDNTVDPRTYWVAVVACGPEASKSQVDTMVRCLEAFYAKQPRARTVHDLARRSGDHELRRFLSTINGLPGYAAVDTTNT